jgi:hypothetical protein
MLKHNEMSSTKKKLQAMSQALREKHVPVPHLPVQISRGLPRGETRFSKIRSLS